jgi:signal transduction histidine kinase
MTARILPRWTPRRVHWPVPVWLVRVLAEGLLLAAWVMLATFLLRLGLPWVASLAASPVWGLALVMWGALAGHLVSRRWLWPGRLVPQVAHTDTPADTLRLDEAVEQGRGEERLRMAQDLHDDIGARLLTLMYQAPTPDMEDYIRHTLHDLKTLTRGLAAPSHRLSAALAEWKRDLTHRLTLARCDLVWQVQIDEDVDLSVVQWSALTRILRELISNAHQSRPRTSGTRGPDLGQCGVDAAGERQRSGPQPGFVVPGLGLGGVRKRVRQLNGEVRWRELSPEGICCEVVVPCFVGAVQRSH